MKKIIFLVILLALLLAACQQQQQETQKEIFGARKVKVATAHRTDISSQLLLTGKLEAIQQAAISSNLPVVVEKILVSEGEQVAKGKQLVQMNQNNLTQAKAQFQNLQKKYERMKKLAATNAVDKQSLEDVEAAFLAAKANYSQVEENTFIKAPFNGIVTAIQVKEGESYNSMTTPYLLRLVQLQKMKAKALVSDKDVVKISTGQRVQITADNYPDKIFSGKVSYVAPEANQLSGTFPIEVVTENPRKLLKNNQMVHLCLETQTAQNTIVVPQKAIMDNDVVFVAAAGNAVAKKVSTGIGNENQIQIISGIETGDKVIIEGNIGLVEGDKIEITK